MAGVALFVKLSDCVFDVCEAPLEHPLFFCLVLNQGVVSFESVGDFADGVSEGKQVLAHWPTDWPGHLVGHR